MFGTKSFEEEAQYSIKTRKKYSSTYVEVLEYFHVRTAVLARRYWLLNTLSLNPFRVKELNN